MNKALISLVAMLAAAAVAQGTLTYSTVVLSSAPGGDTTKETYGLVFSEDNGDFPIGFEIHIGGPVHNINPFGVPTIFGDNNAAIVGTGGDPLGDTQFPYLTVGVNQEVSAAPDSYENGGLGGSWSFLYGLANPLAGPTVTAAQVCIDDGASVPFSATVIEYDPIMDQWSATLNISGVIPEPATLSLLALGGLALIRRRKK